MDNVIQLKEFEADIKKLNKKYRSLNDDFKTFLQFALPQYFPDDVDNKTFFRLSGLKFDTPEIYKVKKFACKSLKGTGKNSGIRLIIAYFHQEKRFELVEIYYKGDKQNESRVRINNLFS